MLPSYYYHTVLVYCSSFLLMQLITMIRYISTERCSLLYVSMPFRNVWLRNTYDFRRTLYYHYVYMSRIMCIYVYAINVCILATRIWLNVVYYIIYMILRKYNVLRLYVTRLRVMIQVIIFVGMLISQRKLFAWFET